MRIVLSLLCLIAACAVMDAAAQEKAKDKVAKTETVKILYRTKFDALAPSSFTMSIGAGITRPLKITWDIPEKDKKALDEAIADLEKKMINGVEFACKGVWIQKGSELRVTSRPELTEDGKKRIKDSNR